MLMSTGMTGVCGILTDTRDTGEVAPGATAKLLKYVSLRPVGCALCCTQPYNDFLLSMFLEQSSWDEMRDDGVDKLESISLLHCRSSTCSCG